MTGVDFCLPIDKEDELEIWMRMPLKIPDTAPTVESLAPLCNRAVKAEAFQKRGYRFIRHTPDLSPGTDYHGSSKGERPPQRSRFTFVHLLDSYGRSIPEWIA
jgi:hypothetical protein